MSRGKASGYKLTRSDAAVVLGMVARGDRDHDIAAWFGVNQGRIAEVKDGSHGSVAAAAAEALPPKGSPGIKGRRLREKVERAISILETKGDAGSREAMTALKAARAEYDSLEA